MPKRLSPIEEVQLVARMADLKLEVDRLGRTLDALIALLEDKRLIHAEQLAAKSWQLQQQVPVKLRRPGTATPRTQLISPKNTLPRKPIRQP